MRKAHRENPMKTPANSIHGVLPIQNTRKPASNIAVNTPSRRLANAQRV